MAKTIPEKTHQQIHQELRDAYNAREVAMKLRRPHDVAMEDAKIAELRGELPPPKGTKRRFK